MAQQLWFLRHGDAEPHGARHDAERRLTEKGERQSDAAGCALARLELKFAVVLTSPRERSLATARLACEHLDAEPLVHQGLSGGFDVDEARRIMARHGEDVRVLAVGHEPDLSQVACDLTGARIDLKKGGVAGVRLDGASGELLALMRPRELAQIAGLAASDAL